MSWKGEGEGFALGHRDGLRDIPGSDGWALEIQKDARGEIAGSGEGSDGWDDRANLFRPCMGSVDSENIHPVFQECLNLTWSGGGGAQCGDDFRPAHGLEDWSFLEMRGRQHS